MPYGLITVDTENPQTATLSGKWDGDSLQLTVDGRDAGISGLMDIFEEWGARATFFLNVYESVRFPSVERVAEMILERGHEVQLHTHPAWMFDAEREHMWQYSLSEQQDIIGLGSQTLEKWTGEKPCAHRAGAYGANENTLEALKACGIRLDSTFFPGHTNCHLSGPVNVIHENAGIVELPIMVYEHVEEWLLAKWIHIPRRRSVRKFDLDWCSAEQLRWFLDLAKEDKVPVVHFFLHSYSLIRWDRDFHRCRWDARDYDKLVGFLRDSKNVFNVEWITVREFLRLYSVDRAKFTGESSHPRWVVGRTPWRAAADRITRGFLGVGRQRSTTS